MVQLWDQCCWGLRCVGEWPLSALLRGIWGLTLLALRHPAAAGGPCCCWLLKGLLSRQCHPLLCWHVVSVAADAWALLLQHQGQHSAVHLCALQVGGRSSCRWGTAHGGTAGRCGRSCHSAHTRVLCRHHPGMARGTSRTPGRHQHTCKGVQLSGQIKSLVGFQLACYKRCADNNSCCWRPAADSATHSAASWPKVPHVRQNAALQSVAACPRALQMPHTKSP